MIECPTDEYVPLPTKSGSQSAKLCYAEIKAKARAAVNAANLLDIVGYKDEPEDMEFVQAITHNALRRSAQGKEVPSEEVNAAISTPASALFVERILTAYDMEVVKDAKRLRHFVTNKLIVETENVDARIRMRALELLGKVSDVGLFTERTEITVNNRSTVELETSLRDKLRKLMDVSGAEDAKIIAPPIKLDAPISAKAMLAGS
jgi:hypothetical protein